MSLHKIICLVILLSLPCLFGFSPGCGEIKESNQKQEVYNNADKNEYQGDPNCGSIIFTFDWVHNLPPSD